MKPVPNAHRKRKKPLPDTQTSRPNPDDFQSVTRPPEFLVSLTLRGTMATTVKADTLAAAREQVIAMISKPDFPDDIDDVTDVDIDGISPMPTKLYLVLRDGKKIQTSRLRPGDIPRDADENGF